MYHFNKVFFILVLIYLSFFYVSTYSQVLTSASTNASLSLKHVTQVAPAPNGQQVAYVVRHINKNTIENIFELYIYNGNDTKLLTAKNSSISNLNWLPNGKEISFLAQGNTYQSIWIINSKDNKIKKLFEFKNDINAFKWSPDGNSVAFVANELTSHSNSIGRLYLAKQITKNLKINPLTSQDYNILQLSDIVNDNGFDWAPDGNSIVFAYQTRKNSFLNDSYKIAIINLLSRSIKNISYTDMHDGIRPLYSPDGNWIAFNSNLPASKVATQLNKCIYFNNQICLYNTQSSKTHCLPNTFNENPTLLGWNLASTSIFLLDWFKSSGLQLYTLDINSFSTPKNLLNPKGFIELLTISLNATHSVIGFGYETSSTPAEVYIASTDNFKLNKISKIQSPVISSLPKSQKISWLSKDNLPIEGLLITPHDYNPQKKYPLLVVLHGGPSNVFSERFTGGCNDGYEMSLPTCWPDLTEKGYVIFQPNYRGSTGYGKAFRLANFGDLGGGDYQDIITGVNQLISKGIADPNRLAIFGWSYGGYLTLWTITHTTQFNAAIAGGSLSDLILFAKGTDIPWYLPAYLGTTYLKNPSFYKERSPILNVKNVTTPLLLFHGTNDKRVPPIQSYEFYDALKNQNKITKLVKMKKQGHMPTDPKIILTNKEQLEQFLKDNNEHD